VDIRSDADLLLAVDTRLAWTFCSWYELRERGDDEDAFEGNVASTIDEAVTELRRYFAKQGAITVHATGVVELEPTHPRASVCGGCGRAWDDSIPTAWTPAPAGRCPFEYEHPDADDEPVCEVCAAPVEKNPLTDPMILCEDCRGSEDDELPALDGTLRSYEVTVTRISRYRITTSGDPVEEVLDGGGTDIHSDLDTTVRVL
jgi:hypothetical protein